jgi:N-acyl-D-aspartate/D-glutamate deacylase
VLAQPVLITNAVVVDGTGAPARAADVRIVAGKIETIGPWEPSPVESGSSTRAG